MNRSIVTLVILFSLLSIFLLFAVAADEQIYHIWACEESPGIEKPVQYNYFNPVKLGEFTIFCSPERIYDQVPVGAIAGGRIDAYLPIKPGATSFPLDVEKIIKEVAERHFIKVILVGSKADITPELENWFKSAGCKTERIFEKDYPTTYVKLAEEYLDSPDTIVITTFNPIAGYLAALLNAPAFAVRFDKTLPEVYANYLVVHKHDIRRAYLVDVGQKITEQYQSEYLTYGNLQVPNEIEKQLKDMGLEVQRITGEYEEDVSIAVAHIAEKRYASLVESGTLERMPLGFVLTTSMRSEWTCTASLIPYAIAKEFFLIEGWNDVRAAYDGRYSRNFQWNLEASERRDHFNAVVSNWVSGYLGSSYGFLGICPSQFTDGYMEFTVVLATNWYGENQIDWAYQEQTIPSNHADVAYHSIKFCGIALDDSLEAQQQRVLTLLILERLKYPPTPWAGEFENYIVNNSVSDDLRANFLSGKKALMMGMDFEDIGGCVFTMDRMLNLSKNYGINWTCAVTSDVIELLPDYLVRFLSYGNVEFGTHFFFHEYTQSLSQKTQKALLDSAIDRQQKYIGNQPLYYCPPYGSFNGFSLTEIEASGFKYMMGLCFFDAESLAQIALDRTDVYDIVFLSANQMYYNGFDACNVEREMAELEKRYYNLSLVPSGLAPEQIPFIGIPTNGISTMPYIISYGHSWNLVDENAWATAEQFFQNISEKYIKTGKVVSAKGREIQQFYRSEQLSYVVPALVGNEFKIVDVTGEVAQSHPSIPGFELFFVLCGLVGIPILLRLWRR